MNQRRVCEVAEALAEIHATPALLLTTKSAKNAKHAKRN
jgi:hypothetical protein